MNWKAKAQPLDDSASQSAPAWKSKAEPLPNGSGEPKGLQLVDSRVEIGGEQVGGPEPGQPKGLDLPRQERSKAANEDEGSPSWNLIRGAGERAGELAGGLFRAGNELAEYADEQMPLGGFVWKDGDIIPSYLKPDEYREYKESSGRKEPLDIAADYWSDSDLGYVPESTWEGVKQEFGENGALSGSAWAEVLGFGIEQGARSIPDMVAVTLNLPGYVMARSGEIGEVRAQNKGKEEADLTDVLEATPFALGSALFERFGVKGFTQVQAEQFGKEALKRGVAYATGRIASQGGKAGGREGMTEFVQEGIIEYAGERLGTGKEMTLAEGVDRGLGGAVGGGVYGTVAGSSTQAGQEAKTAMQKPGTGNQPGEEGKGGQPLDDTPILDPDTQQVAPQDPGTGQAQPETPQWKQKAEPVTEESAPTQPEQPRGLDLSQQPGPMPSDFSAELEVPQAQQAEQEPTTESQLEPEQQTMTDNGTGVFRVPVDQIQVDPQQYQFRSRVNDQGVDQRLSGVQRWDDNRAGAVLLHRRNDGSLFVADGHHRVDLARRLGQGEINARIVNESDGVDVAGARVEAAMNNIADGKAEPVDVAKVFRDSDVPTTEVRKTFDLPSSQVVRDGESLAGLGDNVFGMVTAGQLSEKDGAAIGRSFEQEGRQEAAADAFQRVEPQTEYQRQLLINEIRAAEFAEAQGDQGGLFGDDAQEVSLMQDRLKVLDSLRQRLNSDKRLFKSLNDNADRASEAGNQIATEANEGITEQSARSLDLIGRVTTTPALNDMVNRAARRVYDGEKRADVVKDLKRELMNYEQGANEPGSGRLDSAQSGRATEAPGQEQRAGERVPEQDAAGADKSGQPEGGQQEVAPELDLQAQTEQDLAEQEQQRQQTEQEAAARRREEEQRAQADAEADDFVLSGSDSAIDQAEARGQGNMFDQPAAQAQQEGSAQRPAEAATGASSLTWKKDSNRKIWRSNDGQIITDESFGVGGNRIKFFPVYANDAERGAGNNYTSGESLAEAKSKAAPQQEPAQPEIPEASPKQGTAPSQPIEDFGEKIEGARKDYASKLQDAKAKDTAAVPLSESWPEPDYQKLLDSGADPEAVGFAHAARDEVPPKPRKGWKLKGWTRQVEALRNFTESVIEGEFNVDDMREFARKDGYRALEQHVFNRADLYAAVGHEKSLKGLRFFSAHYSMFDGEKGSFDKWVIERTAKTGAFGNMPRRLVAADSKQEAIDKFREVHDSLGQKGKAAKNVRFDIYSDRHDAKDIFIGKKIGSDVVRIRDDFTSLKEARTYLQENQAELEDRLAKMKQIPNHRKESNSPRVGKDHRNGGDVTPDAFAETFGFRGVQFGNYVEQGRRQQDLNDAYDGLMDLAGILNVPARALSLNGELGLAFGARGKGGKRAPKAHYEPGNIVINLTKKDGAGSLAHEWFHSLDNYFSRERGTTQHMGYATEGSAHISVRPEVAEAFRNVRRTVNRTKLKQRSQKLDKVRTKAYWSTDIEMAARAFESYVIEKLRDQGASNDYLANIVSEEYWEASEALGMQDSDSYPYPEAAEIPEIRAAYDNLFQAIQTREDEAGNVAMFMRKQGATAKGLPKARVQATVNRFLSQYKGADDVQVEIHDNATTLPGFDPARDRGATIAGQYVGANNTVHLVRTAFDSESAVTEALQEEILVHKGLGFFKPEDRQQLYRDIQQAAEQSREVAALWQKTVYEYRPVAESVGLNEEQANRLYAEEMLGTLAQERPNWIKKGWRTLTRGIKRLLVKAGWVKPNISANDLRSRIDLIANAFRRGRQAGRRDFSADIKNPSASESEANIPAFSRTDGGIPTLDAQPFSAPSDTLVRRAVAKIADKFTVLKGVQEQIKKTAGDIPESADAYVAEELFHGKVENDIRLIQEQMVEPLARDMAEYEVSLEQLDEYLYAKHAPERNAVIAERNEEMPDGGSGMTDAEAREVIGRIEQSGKLGEYKMLADQVYRMLERRRSILQEAGLLDSDAIGAWEATYQNYVPLKGWAADESQDGRPRIGKGFAISGAESKIAGGRRSLSASPVAYAISDLSEAVLRHRKNEVGQTFLNLVREFPNDSYWKVYTEENPEVERKPVRVKDPATGKTRIEVREQVVPMAMMSDRYFTVKESGKTLYVKIEDERLMNAMRNIGPDNNNVFIRSLSYVTRIMSSLNTSYSPEFVVSNFSRDIQTALLNLTSEQTAEDGKIAGEKIAAKTLKDTGTAIRAINASLKGKALEGKAGEWQKHFDQFRADGAKTGWFDMKDIDGQVQDIEKLVKMASGGPISLNGLRRAFRWTTDWVENTNSAIENGVRLSAYVNAIDAGVSREKAASLAKNMTVNFNRRGEVGTALNAFFMFANASIQGTNNFVRTLGRLNGRKGDPMWGRMNKAQKIAAGMAVSGFMLSLLNRLVAGDDDDEVNWWDKVPDYVKERNIVIMKSLVGGEPGEYWTIPLPYGYNIFPVMGTQAEHLLFSESQSAANAASNVTLAALGSFSPIGFEQSEEAFGLIAKNVTPTVIKPIVTLPLNENFMGGPIYSEDFPGGTPKPDSSMKFRSTPEAYQAIAQTLNKITGGNEQMTGGVDLSPDVMSYLVSYYGGSAYDFFTNRSVNLAEKLSSFEELEARDIPFVRKISGRVLPYADQSKFYDRRDEINQIVKRREAISGRERVDFVREHRDKLRLKPVLDSTEKRWKALREQRERVESSTTLSDQAKQRRLEMIEKRIKKEVDRFNRLYNQAD